MRRISVEPSVAGQNEITIEPGRSTWRMSLEVFLQNRLAVVGLVIVIFMVLFSFVGPLFWHVDAHTHLSRVNLPPSASHPLGCDELGYDELGRLMQGGQTSLEIGLFAALLATVFGVLWGAISGFFGGLLDTLMMRTVDALLAVPPLFLLLFLASIVRINRLELILVVALVAWLAPARLIRAETLSLRTREYVQAVKVMGGGSKRIIFRHIAPNAVGTIAVNATFQVADAILTIAALSFLGLGLPAPATDWGGMLSTGVQYTYVNYWWLIYPPGLAIVLTVVAFNFLGDALRDALEVRLRRR